MPPFIPPVALRAPADVLMLPCRLLIEIFPPLFPLVRIEPVIISPPPSKATDPTFPARSEVTISPKREIFLPAVRATSPPTVMMSKLAIMSLPASAVNPTRGVVIFTKALKVISLVAFKVTFEVASLIRATSSFVPLIPISRSPNIFTSFRVATSANGVSTISILVGSRSKVPNSPLVALVSTSPRYTSVSLPDTSTNPPSPAVLPPRALMSP